MTRDKDVNAASASPPWADLPADALAEIANHAYDPADFVRFHAVCRKWHDASAPWRRAHGFLPWLLVEPSRNAAVSDWRFRSPFSSKKKKRDVNLTTRYPRALSGLRRVHSSDATTGRVLTVRGGVDLTGDSEASLVNPLTGHVTVLPPLPQSTTKFMSRGVVSKTGVVMFHETTGDVSVTILRPGPGGETAAAARWEDSGAEALPAVVAKGDVVSLDEHNRRAAALCASGVLAGGARAAARLTWQEVRDRYVVEAQGELLCVDVHDVEPCLRRAADEPAVVSVHALEVVAGDDDGVTAPPRWVKRVRGRGTEHVCLFLGWESSFAVDAAEEFAFSAEVTGGCAYFVIRHHDWTMWKPVFGVYRYSFQDGKGKLVDELPACFDRKSRWFTPRPRVSPVRSRGPR